MTDDRQAFLWEEKIPASQVPVDPVHCPRCKGHNLILYGHLSFPHYEVWREGNKAAEETDWKFRKNFELSCFDCVDCTVRFVIQGDENYELEQRLASIEGPPQGAN